MWQIVLMQAQHGQCYVHKFTAGFHADRRVTVRQQRTVAGFQRFQQYRFMAAVDLPQRIVEGRS